MIKARGRSAVLIGLSRDNVTRLMEGKPIRFDGAEIGIPGISFMIMGGETEQAMVDELRHDGLIDVTTQVDDRWPAGVPRG